MLNQFCSDYFLTFLECWSNGFVSLSRQRIGVSVKGKCTAPESNVVLSHNICDFSVKDTQAEM
jgi:hypothetical protein